MKNYKKPTATEVNVTSAELIAASPSLDFTNNNADKNEGVLTGVNRREWGNLWK